MLAAVELVADRERKVRLEPSLKAGARFSKACLDRGLIARGMPHGDILGLAPPLVLTVEEADRIADIVTEALDQVADELTRERVAVPA
jgi:L-2,4-diaminobutyrate transaminase